MPVGQYRTVCSLRPLSVFRIVIGHYSHLGLSRHIQQMLKVYCALIPLIWMSIHYFFANDSKLFFFIYHKLELLAHYTLSMYTKDSYLQEYYKYIPVMDGVPRAREMYSKLEKILPWFSVFVLAELILLCFKTYPINGFVGIFISCSFTFYILMGRIPLMLIFSLLYCRARIFRKHLISTEGRPTRGTGVNNHVLAYIALNESLEKTGSPPMFLLCIQISSWFINMMSTAFMAARFYKSESREVFYEDILTTFLLMAVDTFFVFYPSLMVELASEEVDQSRIFIADQLATCTDKAKRGELEELMYFLRHQPLQYRVCHVVPLSARLPLALLVLGANYLVCALQFTNTFGTNSTRVNTTETP